MVIWNSLLNTRNVISSMLEKGKNAFHIRMDGYRLDIRHRRLEKQVAAHFNSEGHSQQSLSIFVIEQIHKEVASYCRMKKSYWIQVLRLLTPEGLNLYPKATKLGGIMVSLTQFSIWWIQGITSTRIRHFLQPRSEKSLNSVTRPYIRGQNYGSKVTSSCLP